jgi:hypothetical protein
MGTKTLKKEEVSASSFFVFFILRKREGDILLNIREYKLFLNNIGTW